MASVDIYQMTTKDTNHKVAPVTIFDAVVNPLNKKTLDQEFEDMVGAVDESVAVDDADATLVTTALRKTEQVLTQAEKKQVRTNINAADADVITELRNIAITSEEDDGDVNFTEPDVVNEAIRKVPQVLSKAEQKQARTNIGAASVEENAEFLDGVEGAIAEIDAKVSDIGSKVNQYGQEVDNIGKVLNGEYEVLVELEQTDKWIQNSGFSTISSYGSFKYDILGLKGCLVSSVHKNDYAKLCCITDEADKIVWMSSIVPNGNNCEFVDLTSISNGKYLYVSYKIGESTPKVLSTLSNNPILLINELTSKVLGKIYNYGIVYFDKGFFLLPNGTLSEDSLYYTSEFIRCNKRDIRSITTKAVFGNQYGGGIVFYNEDKQAVYSIYNLPNGEKTNTEIKFTIEELCKIIKDDFSYIKVCGRTDDSYIVITEKSIIDTETDKIKADLNINGTRLEGYYLMVKPNIFIDSTGIELSASEFYTSDYIDISGNILSLVIRTQFNNSYGGGLCFYDKDKKFIKSIYNTQTESLTTLDVAIEQIPISAKYIRTSCRSSDVSSTFVDIKTAKIRPQLIGLNIRKVVNIINNDTEEDIIRKMFEAYMEGNCDVVFERGVYEFKNTFDIIHEQYEGSNHNELPIGNNNRYYFNGSTLIGTSVTTNDSVKSNQSLLGSQRKSGSYELYDGKLVANDLVYCVHDEAQGSSVPYVRKYFNMEMHYNTINSTNTIRKCIGGGTGRFGVVVIDKCLFKSDNAEDVNYHGFSGTSASATGEFNLTVSNSYFENGIVLGGLSTNEVASVKITGSSFKTNPTIDAKWDKYLYCNEVRN